MVLLITGAMTPQNDISNVVIKDAEERKSQYILALEKCLKTKGIKKVVYCDNSNPDKIEFVSLLKLADEIGVKFELLSFEGDSKLVSEKGKGYGEGEITKYALEHSRLLADENYFIKLTGRLYIDNLDKIIAHIKEDRCYFNYPNKTIRNMCDTRFYAMPIEKYKEYFGDAYTKVKDEEGFFLEHAFAACVRENKLITFNFPLYPRITGLSASTGAVYTYKWYKCIFKDILSAFQVYRLNDRQ